MYTLLKSNTPRSIGSRLCSRSWILLQHGPVQRPCRPCLRLVKHFSTDTTSSDTAETKTVIDEGKVWEGFESLQPFLQTIFQNPRFKSYSEVKPAGEKFLEYWQTPAKAKKADLSYWNVLRNEIKGKFPKASILAPYAYRVSSHHSPDRALTLLFIFEYYDQISSDQGLTDEAASSLSTLINSEQPAEACERIIDLLHNSWVLLAEPCDLVERYIALAKYRETNNFRPLPLWLLLQIVRTASIDRESITHLVEWLSPRLESWNWMGSSAMILGIRLVRHVRRLRAPDFEAVTTIFLLALSLRFKEALYQDLSTVTHWCNRFLSLLALPAETRPFEAVESQQGAQLDVLQFMQDFQPEIHLGREGYRALARLQIMHAKTSSERQWAEAKTLTWPPWEERNRMGAVVAPNYYAGKETRALKVLNRMVESGYAPHTSEASLKILTGWDTDKSPTIQTRLVPPHIPRAYDAGLELDETIPVSEIWSSRIEATRTVREAWMVFCAYMNRPQPKARQQYVYLAMHKKLIASNVKPDSGLLPGDGPEVFPDPELARDRVYIPEQIPLPSELVSRMIHNNIECNETVLAYFLEDETILDTGLALLRNSSLGSDIRQVLANPHGFSFTHVASALDSLKASRLRCAYVKLLTRPNTLKSQDLQVYQSSMKSVKLDGPAFMWRCLRQTKLDRAWSMTSYIAGLAAHMNAGTKHYYRLHSPIATKYARDALEEFQQTMVPSFATVRVAIFVALRNHEFPVERVKQLFIAAACVPSGNQTVTTWSDFCKGWDRNFRRQLIPADDIEYMVWLLGSQYSTTGSSAARDEIFSFLELIHACKDQSFNAGISFTRQNLAVFRLFLELDWLQQAFQGTHGWETLSWEPSQQVYDMLYALANGSGEQYPDDIYMGKYLGNNRTKIRRVEVKILNANRRIYPTKTM